MFRFRKNRIWHDFLFLSSNSGNRSCVPFWSSAWKVAMPHLLAHHIVSKRSPDRILQAALDRFFLEAVPKLLQGAFFFLGWISFWWFNFEKTKTISIQTWRKLCCWYRTCTLYIYFFLVHSFFLYSYLNTISSIILRL